MRWGSGSLVLASLVVAGCYRSTVRGGGGSDAGRDAPFLVVDDAPIVRPDTPRPDAGSTLLTPCDGVGGFGAELDIRCGRLPMPLDRSDPTSRTLDVYVEAIVPPEPVRAQLWMLQGGPGGATAYSFEAFGSFLPAEIAGLEVMLLDHRGTGESSRIVCEGEGIGTEHGTALSPNEWRECVSFLESIRDEAEHYSTTEAARDLGEAIELLRRPGVPVYVYGVSYGTYWAHRWLQLFPAQADGVVLDSICSPTECSFPIEFSRNFDTVGRDILGRCAADPACRGHLGPDPVGRLVSALAAFDAGTCAAASRAGFTGLELRRMVAALIYDPTLRNALPALAFRASRCADADELAFSNLHAMFAVEPFGDETSFAFLSPTLYAIVARSELWDLPATEAEELTLARSFIAWTPFQPEAFDAWSRVPAYDPGALWAETAVTSVPVMLWQGELDPQTSVPDAAPLRAALSGPSQTYVELPRATHGILARHGLSAFEDCGIRMLRDFVDDPRRSVDTSCRDQEPPLDFEDETLASTIFGTSSLYGLAVSPHTHALTAREIALGERLRELLRATPTLDLVSPASLPGAP